jgi:hypothetical protein
MIQLAIDIDGKIFSMAKPSSRRAGCPLCCQHLATAPAAQQVPYEKVEV